MFFHLCPSASDLFAGWEMGWPSLARHLGFSIKELWRCPASRIWVTEDEFPLKLGDFQDRTVNLPESEGIVHIELNIYIGVELFLQVWTILTTYGLIILKMIINIGDDVSFWTILTTYRNYRCLEFIDASEYWIGLCLEFVWIITGSCVTILTWCWRLMLYAMLTLL